jgi:NADPH2:quinone reductase
MKAVEIAGYGDVDQLRLVERPRPEPGPGQVLIAIEAAGVIFADTLLRREAYVFQPTFPYVPGREVAGRIVATGQGVTDYAEGERVYAFMMGGGYADYVAADVAGGTGPGGKPLGRLMYPIGDAPADQAISHGSNLRIAHLILHGRSSAQPGQTVLIHASAGGVGAHLVRLANEHGMTVIALAGSSEKATYAQESGADHVIEYRTCDYVEAVKALTGGQGAHLSINSVGADTLTRDAAALRWEGEMVISGKAAGAGAIVPSDSGKSLTYKHFASYVHMGRPEDDRACEMVAREVLVPSHDDRIVAMPLTEVRCAHELLESGASFGKIVLLP